MIIFIWRSLLSPIVDVALHRVCNHQWLVAVQVFRLCHLWMDLSSERDCLYLFLSIHNLSPDAYQFYPDDHWYCHGGAVCHSMLHLHRRRVVSVKIMGLGPFYYGFGQIHYGFGQFHYRFHYRILTMNSDCMILGGGGTGGFVCPKSSSGFQLFCSSNVGSAHSCNSPEQKMP